MYYGFDVVSLVDDADAEEIVERDLRYGDELARFVLNAANAVTEKCFQFSEVWVKKVAGESNSRVFGIRFFGNQRATIWVGFKIVETRDPSKYNFSVAIGATKDEKAAYIHDLVESLLTVSCIDVLRGFGYDRGSRAGVEDVMVDDLK